MKRLVLLSLFMSGCLFDVYDGEVVQDPQMFEARLVYDGNESTATISFDSITRAHENEGVYGSVTGSVALTSAKYIASSSTLQIEVAREAGDDQGSTTPLLCTVHEADLGHTTRCNPSSKTASIIVTAL